MLAETAVDGTPAPTVSPAASVEERTLRAQDIYAFASSLFAQLACDVIFPNDIETRFLASKSPK
jgi:hypothetical protein